MKIRKHAHINENGRRLSHGTHVGGSVEGVRQMQRMKTALAMLIALALLWPATTARAQVNAGVLFLRIAPGARAAGIGESFVAMANDATATHWNPAGLGTYPLNTEWSEYPLAPSGQVLDAVPLKNGLPYDNFTGYDLWILTDSGLTVFHPSRAAQQVKSAAATGFTAPRGNTLELSTDGVSSVSAAILRYAPFMTEDEAETIARRSAAGEVGIPLAELEPMLARIGGAMPEGYRDRTTLENVIREFRTAFLEGRVGTDRLPELRTAMAALPESGPADLSLLDRIRFTMERSVSLVLPHTIPVQLNDLIRPPVQAIASDGSTIYVAASNGLLQFNGERWEVVPPPDGIDWRTTRINCLAAAGGRRLWVGTDSGLLARSSGQWETIGSDRGLPDPRVLKITLAGSRAGWVLTNAGLAAYDGKMFSSTASVTANVGDSLRSVVERFLDTDDAVVIGRALEAVRSAGDIPADTAPLAGKTIAIPYSLGIRGDVTGMELDAYDRLWVGTTVGTFRFGKGRWTSFGYEAVLVEEATTAEALAESRLGKRATPERVQRLAEYVKLYNNLPDGQIPAGRTVYVYRNPAGAHILDMAAAGDQMLIATEVGQLEVSSGQWSRYFHGELEQDQVHAIVAEGGDVWFVTDNRVVVYQHPHKEISFMHVNWLPEFNLDLYYEYLTYVANIEGIGTVGAAITFLSYGEIIRTDELGNVGNPFHSFDGALSLSYGTRLNPNLAAGLSAKIIYSRLADQGAGAEIGSGSATAFAMDAGLLYRTPWRRLTLGAALTNVGPNISYIDAQQSDPLPRNLALGFAYRIWDSPYNRLTIIGEANKELVDLTSSTSEEVKQTVFNGGAEYWYGSFVALRGGYIYDQDGEIKTATLGAGLSYQRFEMDVAYIPSNKDLPLANTLRVSMTGRF
ncbi:MAG: PorV/PorQ family protein [Candidatus Zixiibacteriota bacterium]